MLAGILMVAAIATGARADTRVHAEAACTRLIPAAMGGPLPKNKDVIVLRWLGTANYELAYRGRVFLLDAYFDRGPRNRPTGIVPNEVRRTDAIFLGHAHFD